MWENSQVFCSMPLHVGLTTALQPPLSRPTDQNVSNPTMFGFACANAASACASESVNVSVVVSLVPIIGVTPNLAFKPADLSCAQDAPTAETEFTPIAPFVTG